MGIDTISFLFSFYFVCDFVINGVKVLGKVYVTFLRILFEHSILEVIITWEFILNYAFSLFCFIFGDFEWGIGKVREMFTKRAFVALTFFDGQERGSV